MNISSQLKKFAEFILETLLPFPYRFYFVRKIYWDFMAKSIHLKWGNVKGDFELITQIVNRYRVKRILDFGCGSGRLFKLYENLALEEVVAQDISKNALKIAAGRKAPNITLTNTSIMDLDFPQYHFDLIISSRVLQHIPPNEVGGVIRKLTALAQKVFIDEIHEDSRENELSYMFKHDYLELFKNHGFYIVKNGYQKADWALFIKK